MKSRTPCNAAQVNTDALSQVVRARCQAVRRAEYQAFAADRCVRTMRQAQRQASTATRRVLGFASRG